MSVTDLPVALLSKCLSFVGEGQYIYVAGACRSFHEAYNSYLLQQTEAKKAKTTNFDATVESVSRLKIKLLELNIDVHYYEDKLIFGEHMQIINDFWAGVIRRAAYKGNQDVLTWTKNSNPGKWIDRCEGWLGLSASPCNAAARGGQLKVLQWLRSDAGGKCPCNETTCAAAAKNGQLEVLDWLRQKGCPWGVETCAAAAEGGHLETLIWARQNRCPWDKNVCKLAAQNGHLEILKRARQNGCPRFDEIICKVAAFHGRINILKWARENECPWDTETCTYAATKGHFELLKWAYNNDCPWCIRTCLGAARKEDVHGMRMFPELLQVVVRLRF